MLLYVKRIFSKCESKSIVSSTKNGYGSAVHFLQILMKSLELMSDKFVEVFFYLEFPK